MILASLAAFALQSSAAQGARHPAAAPPAAPPPAPVQLDAQWACKTLALNERGEPAGELAQAITVGEPFLLACEGPATPLNRERLSLELPKQARYMLRLISARELTETRAEFLATTWTSGQIKLENPVLSDGQRRVGLGKVELQVSSVIDPQKNPEGQPFGPWGPVIMRWPLWVWGVVAGLIGGVIAIFVLQARRWWRRRRLLRLLEANPIAVKPYHQFNKDLRALARTLPVHESEWSEEKAAVFAHELDQALRWYLARELVVATIGRSPREIARDLKAADPKLHALVRRDLLIALGEIAKARSQKRFSLADAQQLMDLSRAVADRISGAKET